MADTTNGIEAALDGILGDPSFQFPPPPVDWMKDKTLREAVTVMVESIRPTQLRLLASTILRPGSEASTMGAIRTLQAMKEDLVRALENTHV